jgi:hypothetical protein
MYIGSWLASSASRLSHDQHQDTAYDFGRNITNSFLWSIARRPFTMRRDGEAEKTEEDLRVHDSKYFRTPM